MDHQLLKKKVTKLSIGTVQFGLNYGVANNAGKVPFDEVQKILKEAKFNHIDTIDTAAAYGDSEDVLGKSGVQNLQLITKLSEIPSDVNDITTYIEDSFFNSLQRLKVKKVYGFLLHRPSQLSNKGGGEIYQTLLNLKEQGYIEKIGASIYQPEELDVIYKNYELDLIQSPFNIFDRRLIETDWLSRLNERGVEIHIRSVFLQGLLLMSSNQRPEKFKRWDNLWKKWDNWLKENNITPLEACIKYALAVPEISKVVIGVNSDSQLKEIIVAANGTSPEIPNDLFSNDTDLLNPANWNNL
jgi:aryl-alcohol dehydrogenase-like predicted oxidoreductase